MEAAILPYAIPAIKVLIDVISGLLKKGARFQDDLETLRTDLNATMGIVNAVERSKPRDPYIIKWMKGINDASKDCERVLKKFEDSGSGIANASDYCTCLPLVFRCKDMNELKKVAKRFNKLALHRDVILELCRKERPSFAAKFAAFGGVMGIVGAVLLILA